MIHYDLTKGNIRLIADFTDQSDPSDPIDEVKPWDILIYSAYTREYFHFETTVDAFRIIVSLMISEEKLEKGCLSDKTLEKALTGCPAACRPIP